MVKQTIQIFARVKPPARKHQQGIYSIDEDEKLTPSLEIILPRDLADGFVNNKRESYRFKFQRIFDHDAKQEIIFENIAKPVAESVLAGYNSTIFAYGQTGSGKTFTITGGAERYSDRGIIPRTLSYIFEQLQKDSSKIYTTYISYLEIYNECGYDLLDPRHEASRLEDLPKVTILEDPDQNIHLKNLSLHQATTEEAALNLLFLGDTNRMIAETPMNQASTRSHCIFTVHLSSKEPGSATVRHAKLHLVDLAGSERVAKTGVGGQLLTEAKYINLSLHYLEQVIIALSEKNRSHIPYRNSMMTSVLRDSLGGNCMTTMIATLSLEKRNIEESISTCRFAQRVSLIKNEAVLNEEIDPRLMIIRLQKEVQELKDELAIVTGERRTEALTEEELLQLEKLITSFLEDQDPESRLEVGADMRKIHHCFHHFKKLLDDKKILGKSAGPSETENQDCQEPLREEEYRKLQDVLKQRDSEINILVNMLKKEKKKTQDAHHLSSMDRSETRPSQGSSFPCSSPQEGQRTSLSSVPAQAQDFGTYGYRSSLLHKKTGTREEMSLGRQEAFEIFKRDHADSVTIDDNKQILKQRFSEAKALGESINEARRKIGHLKDAITQRHMQQVALGISENIAAPLGPDPQEEQLRLQLEEEKRRYKAMFTRLKALKVEIEHLQLLMDKAKVKLQKEFEAWWAAEATSLQVHSPAANPLGLVKPFPQAAEPQQDWLQLLANRSAKACNSDNERDVNEKGIQCHMRVKVMGGPSRGWQDSPTPPRALRAAQGMLDDSICLVAAAPHAPAWSIPPPRLPASNPQQCGSHELSRNLKRSPLGYTEFMRHLGASDLDHPRARKTAQLRAGAVSSETHQALESSSASPAARCDSTRHSERRPQAAVQLGARLCLLGGTGTVTSSPYHGEDPVHSTGMWTGAVEDSRDPRCLFFNFRSQNFAPQRNDVNSRNIPPTPCPSPAGQEQRSPSAQLEGGREEEPSCVASQGFLAEMESHVEMRSGKVSPVTSRSKVWHALVPSIPERPVSVPLTGDSQTDSDILAFIRARQSILQKKCKCTVAPWGRGFRSARQH
ncbi:kinesin-like protein KIF6 [Erethizon dorsatum]